MSDMPTAYRFLPWPAPVIPDNTIYRGATHEVTIRHWLPILGPTSMMLVWYLTPRIRDEISVVISSDELAARLGVKPSILHRTVRRLERYGMMAEAPILQPTHPTFRLKEKWPPPNPMQLMHLIPELRKEIDTWIADHL
jgi:hypothetical protein